MTTSNRSSRERQEVAAVVDPDADVGPREQVVVDVLEELGALAHGVRELDDQHVGVVLADRTGRRAAAQTDDQRPLAAWGAAPSAGGRSAGAGCTISGRIRGLVQPVEIHQPAAKGVGVDADRGLHAFLAPEDALAASVPPRQRRVERIGHGASADGEERRRAPPPRAGAAAWPAARRWPAGRARHRR